MPASSFAALHDQFKALARDASSQSLSPVDRELVNALQPGSPTQVRTRAQAVQTVRTLLEHAGTCLQENNADPAGDGDQRRVPSNEPQSQIIRELFAVGGDIEYHLAGSVMGDSGLTPMGLACVQGDLKTVQSLLKQAKQQQQDSNNERLHRLLEYRETSLRLPPVFLAIALSKHPNTVRKHTGFAVQNMQHEAVVYELLRYGARPDAKDALGKTVVHYGAGVMANPITLNASTACIEAAKTCAFLGQEVVLQGLSKTEFNGKKGTLGGFHAESTRRTVCLQEGKKELSLKPENIFYRNATSDELQCIYDDQINLCDVPDRVGGVALHEVVMSKRNDVAKYLLEKQNASMDVEDNTGLSPRKMVFKNQQLPGMVPINDVMKKHATRQGRKLQKAERKGSKACANPACTETNATNLCTACRSVFYCGRDCQHADWKDHKPICKERRTGIKLTGTISCADHPAYKTMFTGNKKLTRGRYCRPKGVGVDERFWIKVQSNGLDGAVLIYDESRVCGFEVKPHSACHRLLVETAQQEKAFMGRKTYMEARFDDKGDCYVHPHTAALKKW